MSTNEVIGLAVIVLAVIWFGMLIFAVYVSNAAYRMGVRDGISYLKGDRSFQTEEAGELIRSECLDDWMRDARG